MNGERSMLVRNESNGRTICDRATLTGNLWERIVGLLGRPDLELGEGMLFRSTTAVHTVGMSVRIDVIGLDRHDCVTGIFADLKPGRVAFPGWRTRSILELPAGQTARTEVKVGDHLRFVL